MKEFLIIYGIGSSLWVICACIIFIDSKNLTTKRADELLEVMLKGCVIWPFMFLLMIGVGLANLIHKSRKTIVRGRSKK